MRLLLVPLLLATAPAAAAPQFYASATAFNRAAGPTVRETFDRCHPVTTAFAGALDSSGNEACAAGAIRAGISFSDSDGPFGHQLYIAAPKYAANRTTALGQNDPSSDALIIRFDLPVRAAAFDLFQNVGGGASLAHAIPVTVTLAGADGMALGSCEVAARPNRANFFGVTDSGAAIASVSVNSPINFDLIDNLRFAGAPAVTARNSAIATPEPAAFALLFPALAALRLRRRRK